VRKGRRTAEKTKEGTQTSPAIGERKGHQVAAAEKEANSRPANTGIPSRAPVVRALTPHENFTRPAIGGMKKGGRIATVEEETETLPVNTEVPAKTPLVQAAMPHKSIALPDRNVGLESDMQHSG
jgi:hypothetical protein